MRLSRWFILLGLAVCLVVLVQYLGSEAPPPIPYAQGGERYSDKVDFARLEHELPLTRRIS